MFTMEIDHPIQHVRDHHITSSIHPYVLTTRYDSVIGRLGEEKNGSTHNTQSELEGSVPNLEYSGLSPRCRKEDHQFCSTAIHPCES